ncbi:hypothetical protein KCP76_25545 [Salmonella enterica subsp. enterica serovar Weltevreden]|nr:hypothetical protein KCP76_25545 [Salmonella enterica subsp. enterica serovar Weltevreden]
MPAKKTRYTEEQIAFALKQAGNRHLASGKSAENGKFLKIHFLHLWTTSRFASTESGFKLLSYTIRHQEKSVPKWVIRTIIASTTGSGPGGQYKNQVPIVQVQPGSSFLSTLQLLLAGINFTLPDTRYHFSASTRLFRFVSDRHGRVLLNPRRLLTG